VQASGYDMIDAISSAVFKSELRKLLRENTELSELVVHCICLLGCEVLERDEFFTCMQFEENTDGII
jgi:hypothetical protein